MLENASELEFFHTLFRGEEERLAFKLNFLVNEKKSKLVH